MSATHLLRASICASLFVCVGWFGGPQTALAADPVALAQEAVEKSKAGDHLGALKSIEGAYMAIWDQTPFGIKRSLFVTEPATGFGIYKPRQGTPFKNGETLRVYVEPIGYAFTGNGNMYSSLITVDFNLRTKGGEVLGGQRNFARFAITSHERNTEFYMNLTYSFSGAPKGDYVLETILQDKLSGKLARFELPFQIE